MPRVPRARTLRRAEARRLDPADPVEPTTIDLIIPSPGPARFRAGWGFVWALIGAQARRPFALLPLLGANVLAFSAVKMLAIYLIGLAWWGRETPTPELQQWFNTGLWEILSWGLAPAILTPWFAARVLFAHGLKVPMALVKEPLAAPRRGRHLLLLGAAAVIVVGGVGSQVGRLAEAMGLWPTVAIVATAWWAGQVLLAAAAAGVWRDGLSAPHALWAAFSGTSRSWRPVMGASLALAAAAIMVVGLLLTTVVAPLMLMRVPPEQLQWVGLLLLPVLGVLAATGWHLRAALGLAVLEWGEKPSLPLEPSLEA